MKGRKPRVLLTPVPLALASFALLSVSVLLLRFHHLNDDVRVNNPRANDVRVSNVHVSTQPSHPSSLSTAFPTRIESEKASSKRSSKYSNATIFSRTDIPAEFLDTPDVATAERDLVSESIRSQAQQYILSKWTRFQQHMAERPLYSPSTHRVRDELIDGHIAAATKQKNVDDEVRSSWSGSGSGNISAGHQHRNWEGAFREQLQRESSHDMSADGERGGGGSSQGFGFRGDIVLTRENFRSPFLAVKEDGRLEVVGEPTVEALAALPPTDPIRGTGRFSTCAVVGNGGSLALYQVRPCAGLSSGTRVTYMSGALVHTDTFTGCVGKTSHQHCLWCAPVPHSS